MSLDTRIGPGRLVLVVGASGAGKDTLIAHARSALRNEPDIVFVRRCVTRPGSAEEDNETLAPDAFAEAERGGAFALVWHAHGLSYGLPIGIDADLSARRTVVCNISRGMVAPARRRYAHVLCIAIEASAELRRARLAARGRASDGPLDARLDRGDLYADFTPDRIIDNSGRPERAAAELVDLIRGAGRM